MLYLFPLCRLFLNAYLRPFWPLSLYDKHPRLSKDILHWKKIDGGLGLLNVGLY